jgi:hypothetical protein
VHLLVPVSVPVPPSLFSKSLRIKLNPFLIPTAKLAARDDGERDERDEYISDDDEDDDDDDDDKYDDDDDENEDDK